MPSRPTDDDERGALDLEQTIVDLLGAGVETVQLRRPCGCLTRTEEGVLILEPCGDPVHLERLGLFWKTVAHAHDMTYGIEHPGGESIRELTCGCAWRLLERTLYVVPCETEHHDETLAAISREYCQANDIDIDVVVKPQ